MFERPRGTRDFGPEDMAERRKLESILRATFESFGYMEIMTPTFEHAELFVERSGEQILEEMYVFEDKSGRKLALRPELTAPVMRFYTEKMQRLPKPLRLYYLGPAYRYERPQKGRYREFWQIGIELIGTDTAEGIAETISVAYESMKNAGLKDFRLRIGDVRILKNFLESRGMNRREIMRAIDKRDEDMLSEEILEFLSIDSHDKLREYGPEDEVEHYIDVLEILKAADVEYVMDMGIARGLDYYTGVVFEIDAPNLGAERQICGGGEYRLAEMFGAKPVAASGFATGFDRTLLALKKEGFRAEIKEPCAYIIPHSREDVKNSFRLSKMLRKVGLGVEMEINGRSIGKALKRADSMGSRYSVIVNGSILTLKNMETGEQNEIKEMELLKELESACKEGEQSD